MGKNPVKCSNVSLLQIGRVIMDHIRALICILLAMVLLLSIEAIRLSMENFSRGR